MQVVSLKRHHCKLRTLRIIISLESAKESPYKQKRQIIPRVDEIWDIWPPGKV